VCANQTVKTHSLIVYLQLINLEMLKHTLFVPKEESGHRLLCLHTSLPSHQLAYFLNKNLNIKLKRDRNDLDARNNTEQYPVFSYCSPKEKSNWRLIGNKLYTSGQFENSNSLFETTEQVHYLFNTLNSVDFLLDLDPTHQANVQSKLQNSPLIQSCYPLPNHLAYIKQQLSF